MKELSPEQAKAASALARGLSQERAGQEAGVTRRTVIRWSKDPAFQREVNRLKLEIKEVKVETVERIVREEEISLSSLLPKALGVLQQILDDPDSRSSDRLKAVSLVGAWAGVAVAQSKLNDEQQFPSDIPSVQGGAEVDFSTLSDEELNRLYLEKLPGGSK